MTNLSKHIAHNFFFCRPSSPKLSQSVHDGVRSMSGTCKDFGLLTTPQLHYIVACYNQGRYNVSEEDYYKQFCAAFKSLINNVNSFMLLSDAIVLKSQIVFLKVPVSSPVTVDCAHGVGASKLRKLGDNLGVTTIDIVVHNEGSGSGRLNEKCGADYVKVQQKAPFG